MGLERSTDEVEDTELAIARTLSYQKPFAYWRSYSESGLQRSLFYAAGPGNHRKFWTDNPETGRKLTRKYLDAIGKLGAAGWQPITNAWTIAHDTELEWEGPAVRKLRNGCCWVERYGSDAGEMYFTIRRVVNDGKLTLMIDLKSLGVASCMQVYLEDIINGTEYEGTVTEDGILEIPIDVKYKETLALKLQCRDLKK